MRTHTKTSRFRLSAKSCGLVVVGVILIPIICCISGIVFNIRIPFHSSQVATVGGVEVEFQTYSPILSFIPTHGGWGAEKHVLWTMGKKYQVARLCKPQCAFVPEANALLFLEVTDDDQSNAVVVDVSSGKVQRFPLYKENFRRPVMSLIPGCNAPESRVIATRNSIELWEPIDDSHWQGARFNLLTGKSEPVPDRPPP